MVSPCYVHQNGFNSSLILALFRLSSTCGVHQGEVDEPEPLRQLLHYDGGHGEGGQPGPAQGDLLVSTK